MVYEPYSLSHRTNVISLSFSYKRLKVMPKLYLHRFKVQYRSEIQTFFCDIFVAFLSKWNASSIMTPNTSELTYHYIYKLFFLSVLHYRNLKVSVYMKLSTFHKFLSFFCSIKAFIFMTIYRIKDYKQLPKNILN